MGNGKIGMMTFIKSIEKDLNLNLNEKIKESNVLFITGAGISVPDPCSFLLGKELHKILLLYYTEMSSSEIDEILDKNSITFEKTVEIILDEFGNLDQDNIFFNLLTEIFIYREEETWKQQNDYHEYFRQHIRQNGKHLTVNLDQFIELDYRDRIEPFTANKIDENFSVANEEGFLLKLHGDPNIDSVGLQGFLHRILENGFSDHVKAFLDKQISQAELVIFVGYGGVDEYDVTPYFEEKAGCYFKDTKGLWINYDPNSNSLHSFEELPITQKVILSKFKNSLLVKCSPELILNKLFDKNSFKIRNAHRKGGYKREYENIFRINSVNEVTKDNDKKREYLQRRKNITKSLKI